MEQKEQKSFPVGRIIKIINGIMSGNKPDSITKVLSKPGIVKDSESQIGVKNGKHMLLQLCENVTSERISIGTYTKPGTRIPIPCFYEDMRDMVPATDNEKKHYRKTKKLNKKRKHEKAYY